MVRLPADIIVSPPTERWPVQKHRQVSAPQRAPMSIAGIRRNGFEAFIAAPKPACPARHAKCALETSPAVTNALHRTVASIAPNRRMEFAARPAAKFCVGTPTRRRIALRSSDCPAPNASRSMARSHAAMGAFRATAKWHAQGLLVGGASRVPTASHAAIPNPRPCVGSCPAAPAMG